MRTLQVSLNAVKMRPGVPCLSCSFANVCCVIVSCCQVTSTDTDDTRLLMAAVKSGDLGVFEAVLRVSEDELNRHQV